MTIDNYETHERGRREAAHAEYLQHPQFREIESLATALGYRHATISEINASVDTQQWAPELFCWRGGLWVRMPTIPLA